jgi:hypothetical protein
VADIFVSYTSTDRDWAFWVAKQLEPLGHTPHIHEWRLMAAMTSMPGSNGTMTPPTTCFA